MLYYRLFNISIIDQFIGAEFSMIELVANCRQRHTQPKLLLYRQINHIINRNKNEQSQINKDLQINNL